MARKVSERERLLRYAMTADKEQIEEALDIFKTALASRFEKKERKKPKTVSVDSVRRKSVIDGVELSDFGMAAGKGAA